jgi:hypothetical protein
LGTSTYNATFKWENQDKETNGGWGEGQNEPACGFVFLLNEEYEICLLKTTYGISVLINRLIMSC